MQPLHGPTSISAWFRWASAAARGVHDACVPVYRQRWTYLFRFISLLLLFRNTYRLCSYFQPKFNAVRRTCSVLCSASVGCNNAFVGVFSYQWLYCTALSARHNHRRKRTPDVSSHAAYPRSLRALPIRTLPMIQMRMVESATRSIN